MWFLANENFPLSSIRLIRENGYRISSILEDSPGIKDEEVLEIAANNDQLILTFDRDYGELNFRKKLPGPEGIVYYRITPLSPNEPALLLFEMLKLPGFSLYGMFTTVERDRSRQRPLK